MYNITLKHLKELKEKSSYVETYAFNENVVSLKDAEDILEKFEVALRQELERRYLGKQVKQEIPY